MNDSHIELGDANLTLRSPVDADGAAVAAAVQASVAELSPWMPWATDAYNEASALQWIRGELGDQYRFLMIADGEHVGSCGLNNLDEQNKIANLGYWVRSDVVGKGYATTATRLLHQFGHANGLHRLEVIMSTENQASRRVAEKAGAHYEGIAVGRLLLNGTHHDAHVYSFTRGARTQDL